MTTTETTKPDLPVTAILIDYRDGKMTRDEMLDKMRHYPWKRVKQQGRPGTNDSFEWGDWPQPGTSQEVVTAAAKRIITMPDRDAILDAIRATVGAPTRRS